MSAELLKPSTADDDLTRFKLPMHQQQQARYYHRGARELTPLKEGDLVRIKPWKLGKNGKRDRYTYENV
jgi:hypothetical protein